MKLTSKNQFYIKGHIVGLQMCDICTKQYSRLAIIDKDYEFEVLKTDVGYLLLNKEDWSNKEFYFKCTAKNKGCPLRVIVDFSEEKPEDYDTYWRN